MDVLLEVVLGFFPVLIIGLVVALNVSRLKKRGFGSSTSLGQVMTALSGLQSGSATRGVRPLASYLRQVYAKDFPQLANLQQLPNNDQAVLQLLRSLPIQTKHLSDDHVRTYLRSLDPQLSSSLQNTWSARASNKVTTAKPMTTTSSSLTQRTRDVITINNPLIILKFLLVVAVVVYIIHVMSATS